MNSEENKPKSLQLEDNIFHLDLHPSNDLVVTGMINGRIQWSVIIEEKISKNELHTYLLQNFYTVTSMV
jgi:hypothetical protein